MLKIKNSGELIIFVRNFSISFSPSLCRKYKRFSTGNADRGRAKKNEIE